MPRGAEGVATRSRVLSEKKRGFSVSEAISCRSPEPELFSINSSSESLVNALRKETADEVGREEDVRPPGVKASKAAKRKKHGNEAAFDQIETILAAKNILSKQKILDRSRVQRGGCVDGCRSLFLYVSNQVTGGNVVVGGCSGRNDHLVISPTNTTTRITNQHHENHNNNQTRITNQHKESTLLLLNPTDHLYHSTKMMVVESRFLRSQTTRRKIRDTNE
ncbi:hypothetical protein YC2023_069313 [Brassica napus]